MPEDARKRIREQVAGQRAALEQQQELAERCETVREAMRSGRPQDAVSLAEKLAEAYPESTTALELLGDTLLAAGKRTGARDAFKKAMELEPANADAERKYAEAMLFISQASRNRDLLAHGSIADIRGAFNKDPRTAATRSMLFPGLGQLYNGDYEKGIAAVLLGFPLFGMAAWGIIEFMTSAIVTSSDPMSAGEALIAIFGCVGYGALVCWSVWDAQRRPESEQPSNIDPDATP